MSTKIYMLENLGCAHCAAKMEEKIGELPGVLEATITYATQQLRINAEDQDRYLLWLHLLFCQDYYVGIP